jgi:hypothetical protein
MKVYQVSTASERYTALAPDEGVDMVSLPTPVGTPCASAYADLGVQRTHPKRALGDFASLVPGMLACSARAVEALGDLRDEVEVIPLRLRGGPPYFLLNPLRCLDALDLARSQVRRYPSSGRIADVTAAVFKTELLEQEGVHLFKTPELGRAVIYCTEPFLAWVAENALTGFTPKIVFDSERAPAPLAPPAPRPREATVVVALRPLVQAERTELAGLAANVRGELGLPVGAEPRATLDAIRARLAALSAPLPEAEVAPLVAAWGEALRGALGWDWCRAELRGGAEVIALSAPDESVLCAPQRALAAGPDASALLANMLLARQTPRAAPGERVLLA